MIEAVISQYLNETITTVPTYTEKPRNMAELDSFILIEKTGGSKSNRIRSATFAIQSYGSTLAEAAQLNVDVIEAMEAILALDSIGRCELNSDYNYTDTTTKKYRYQAIFDITYYE